MKRFLILLLAIGIFVTGCHRHAVVVTPATPLPPIEGVVEEPDMVVIPETDVYFIPGSPVDVFFYGGWWWRPWGGSWYRSNHHLHGWAVFPPPPFIGHIPGDYRTRFHTPIPYRHFNNNWKTWEGNKYHHTPGFKGYGGYGYKPPPPKGHVSPPPKGHVSPPKGHVSPPKGHVSPPPKGNVSPPKGHVSPPPKGHVSPPPKGKDF
jgi:hypothetical protein